MSSNGKSNVTLEAITKVLKKRGKVSEKRKFSVMNEWTKDGYDMDTGKLVIDEDMKLPKVDNQSNGEGMSKKNSVIHSSQSSQQNCKTVKQGCESEGEEEKENNNTVDTVKSWTDNSDNPLYEDGQLCQLDIGNGCYVVAKSYNDEMLIHIRKYEKRFDGSLYPTKKGIALNLEKWKKLEEWKSAQIDSSIEEYKNFEKVDYMAHLGSNYHVSLCNAFPLVNIRRWFLPEDEQEIKPTRTGISLTLPQWEKLKMAMTVVRDILGDELEKVSFCELSDSHLGQMGYLTCSNCNPNTYMNY